MIASNSAMRYMLPEATEKSQRNIFPSLFNSTVMLIYRSSSIGMSITFQYINIHTKKCAKLSLK